MTDRVTTRILAWSSTAAAAGVLLGIASAAPALRRLRSRLAVVEHRATHDPLTGLLNRAGLYDRYTARAPQGWLSIVDVDGFKAVNDTHGHPAADMLLTDFAAHLHRTAVAMGGIAGRLGGDEFVLLLPDSSEPIITVRLAEALNPPHPHPHDGQSVVLTGSGGLTQLAAGLSWPDALHRADVALYHAKRGCAVVACYRPGMTQPPAATAQAEPPDQPAPHTGTR